MLCLSWFGVGENGIYRMTQKNKPGYPLPSGELGEDEIVCQLVYLPNRNEYWQALLGAISYMSTWKAWERDAGKRGKDAAANWREAFELTIGCWRMTCLEDLTNTVTDILELMQTRKDCCDDNITYLPTEEPETEIEPWEGDPPDYYGETSVEDWEEWMSHVCYNAHLYVDYLAHAGDQLLKAFTTSSIFIGVIAALLSLLAFSGIGLPIAFGLAAGIVSGIILTGTLLTFEDTEEDIEDARDAIVCAILHDGDIGAEVEAALGSGADWDLFYQFIDYASARAIIYEGGYGSSFLPTETSEDCGCETRVVKLNADTMTGHSTLELNSKNMTDPTFEWEEISFYFVEDSTSVPKNASITGISHTPTPVNDGTDGTYLLFDKDSVEVYHSDVFPPLPITGCRLHIMDNRSVDPPPPYSIEFDATITWEDL